METITKKVDLYKFNELKEEARDKAINDYINFMVDTIDYENINKHTNLYKAIKKCEDLQIPWFLGQYIWEYCEKSILKEVNRYYYLENGVVYNDEI